MSKSQRQKQKQPWWLGHSATDSVYWVQINSGAAASMAVCFTHPLDQTKYRMQVMQTKAPMLQTLSTFAARDGIPSLWTGLSASILRQSTYSTARFGLYTLLTTTSTTTSSQPISTTHTILAAGASGALAGLLGNPAEVILVRMSANAALAPSQRTHYPDAVRGLARIFRTEGVLATWRRGLGATVIRSVLMNVGQILPYTVVKRRLVAGWGMEDGTRTHMLASLVAGTVATTVCAPADVLKSRLQAAGAGGGKSGLLQVLSQGLKQEGPLFLMKGWTPAWLRLTPHTILTFVFMEKLQDFVNWRAVKVAPLAEVKI